MTKASDVPLRSWIVRITIVSFSLAALMGVVALLTGGEFGATEGRILQTTLLVGTVSVLVLCYLTTAGTSYQPVGVAGGGAALVVLASALYLIWARYDVDAPLLVGRTFGVGSIMAATLAQGCLLLAMGSHRTRLVGRVLIGTLVLAAALAGLTSALVVGLEPDGAYFRVLGIVAILDVLGIVVVAALARFGGDSSDRERGLVVPEDLTARLEERAAALGQPPDALLRTVIEAHLAAASPPRHHS